MTRTFIISLFCLSLSLSSFGQVNVTDKSKDSLKTIALSKPLGWFNDYEHIFTTEQTQELDQLLNKFEKETTNEIVVVTIDSSWTTKSKFDSLIFTIANKWGVGKKNINNGILIGISKSLRRIRITNGYGITDKLSDEETLNIINDIIIPDFKKANYFEGIKNGILAIMNKIR